MSADGGLLVVALGGNAIARVGDDGSVEMQYRRASEAMSPVVDLVREGHRVVLTHGNGPVVGNIVLRGELARAAVPPTPLYISDADSQGGIGLMLQQVLGNRLRHLGLSTLPVSLVTQVVVDADDEAFANPTKPIGPRYAQEDVRRMCEETGWSFAEETPGRWRRVVPSPKPRDIVELRAVQTVLEAGHLPIAAGGGGVPVVERDGSLHGVDAVIDKDWAGALLAHRLQADLFVVLMEADAVYRDWGGERQSRIESISARDAASLASSGEMAEGSIQPKVQAAAWLAGLGTESVICRAENLSRALKHEAGTRVTM